MKTYFILGVSTLFVLYASFVVQKTCHVDTFDVSTFMSYIPGLGSTHSYDPEKETNPNFNPIDRSHQESDQAGTYDEGTTDVPEDDTKLKEVRGKNVRWQVPDGTKRIIITIQSDTGAFINEYEITKFIDISAGQKMQLKAK